MANEKTKGEKEENDQSILGLSTHQLAGLTVEELTNNPTAIKMLLHYYKQLLDDNNAQSNEINTLRTYANAYQEKKNNAAYGGALLALSNLLVAFAVNLLTNREITPGIALIIPGIVLLIVGLFFTYRDKS